jgi:DNA-binding transcriptional MerR regulator
LQQILFFRELGIALNDIQKILTNDDFDKIKSLKKQRAALLSDVERSNVLIKTIDKTILHIEGKVTMQVEEFFDPIKLCDSKIHKEYEKYLVDKGILSQAEMNDSWNKIKQWKQSDWDRFKTEGNKFYLNMTDAILNEYSAGSPHVQDLVNKQYLLISPLWTFNQASYIKLAKSYETDDNFQKFCGLFHPNLHGFLIESMCLYAKKNLT